MVLIMVIYLVMKGYWTRFVSGVVLANASLDIAFHDTYYVVALQQSLQKMGQDIFIYSEIDYMLGTMLLVNYLLFILYYHLWNRLDLSGSFNLLLNSENNNYTTYYDNKYSNNVNIQSAENCKGFSETIRQLFKSKYFIKRILDIPDEKFCSWLAGVIDGKGIFDIRKDKITRNLILKSVKIKVNNRDIRILIRIQNILHMGRIIKNRNIFFSTYIVSTNREMYFLIKLLNGKLRIKSNSLKKVCTLYNVNYIEPDYNIIPYDPYFSGLIDTKGSICFNFNCNRIECNLELKYNNYTSKLILDQVVPYYIPSRLIRKNKLSRSLPSSECNKSLIFKFQKAECMWWLYDYFKVNRLYSDYKFYRITQIKRFIEIRDYKYSDFYSIEYIIFSTFLLKWVIRENRDWFKISFLKYLTLNKEIVQKFFI